MTHKFRFRVAPGEGPLQVKDAGGNVEVGPFLEGAVYDCSAAPHHRLSQWKKAGKIEVIQ